MSVIPCLYHLFLFFKHELSLYRPPVRKGMLLFSGSFTRVAESKGAFLWSDLDQDQ